MDWFDNLLEETKDASLGEWKIYFSLDGEPGVNCSNDSNIQPEPNIETTCEKIDRPVEKQIIEPSIEKPIESKPNPQINDLLAVAESIKNKRKPSMSTPKPIKVQKYAHYKKL